MSGQRSKRSYLTASEVDRIIQKKKPQYYYSGTRSSTTSGATSTKVPKWLADQQKYSEASARNYLNILRHT